MSVIDEIRDERGRQDRQWGGKSHDEAHTPWDWNVLLSKHLGKAASATMDAEWGNYRHRLIVVAALAVAAVEAYDRLSDEARDGSPFVQFSADAQRD